MVAALWAMQSGGLSVGEVAALSGFSTVRVGNVLSIYVAHGLVRVVALRHDVGRPARVFLLSALGRKLALKLGFVPALSATLPRDSDRGVDAALAARRRRRAA